MTSPLKQDWVPGNTYTAADQNNIARQVNQNTGGVVNLDEFSGADDDAKLTAAMSYAAAQTHIPAIRFPPRDVTFNTSARVPYNGMRLIGPAGAVGPKNPDISSTLLPGGAVFLNVGNGTSAWFNGTAAVYDVYIGDLTFWEGNSNAQFWNQSMSTAPGLYACQFHALTFYGFKHIIGTPADQAAVTQVTFTGHWQIIGFNNTAFTLAGSDNSFWMDTVCNLGTTAAAPSAGTPVITMSTGKTNVGKLYATMAANWKGLNYVGGTGTSFFSTVFEGESQAVPATHALITVTGGDCAFYSPQINHLNPAGGVNGCVEQSGGRIALFNPAYLRATAAAATFPLLYQTGGIASIYDPVCQTTAEDIRVRYSDGTTTVLYDVNTPHVASITSSATPTFNVDYTRQLNITALAVNITSMTSGMTGVPVDGQPLVIRIKGTAARTITWGTAFSSSGSQTLLATTATTKTHVLEFVYDAVLAKFVCTYVDATGY